MAHKESKLCAEFCLKMPKVVFEVLGFNFLTFSERKIINIDLSVLLKHFFVDGDCRTLDVE